MSGGDYMRRTHCNPRLQPRILDVPLCGFDEFCGRAKKAMADFGMADLTGAEAFWYILMCIPFGAGYFAKLPVAKALSELAQFRR